MSIKIKRYINIKKNQLHETFCETFFTLSKYSIFGTDIMKAGQGTGTRVQTLVPGRHFIGASDVLATIIRFDAHLNQTVQHNIRNTRFERIRNASGKQA